MACLTLHLLFVLSMMMNRFANPLPGSLNPPGLKSTCSANRKHFLRHLTTHSVPVAVLDIWMENMTGMELLAHLCARSPKTRVIFITGHEDYAAEATVRQAGAFAFFIKPFDNKRFLAAVREAFDGTFPEKEAQTGP